MEEKKKKMVLVTGGACPVKCAAPSAIRLWRWLQSNIAPGLRLTKVPLLYFTGPAHRLILNHNE